MQITAGYEDGMYTIPDLAKKVGVRTGSLYEAANRAHHPLPTVQFGAQKRVLWSQFISWAIEHYGNDGELRGMGWGA